ncbi:MAG: NADH-quinone oxidoreductase subunit L [Candidatus Velthaea sp.]
MTSINPAFVPTGVLFTGALLQIVLGGMLSRAVKGWLAFLTTSLALVAVLAMMPAVIGGEVLTATWFDWDAGVPLTYHVDGLSILFMLLGTGMGSLILLYSVGYMEAETEGTTRFYVLMLLFIAGFVVLVCTSNLLMAYFAWELIGLCSYFLVGFWYKQQAAADGSRKVLIITHLAGYGLLAAIMLLFVRTGTFMWTDPGVAAAFSGAIALLMIVAAMAKSVMYPLHSWIPEAMNAPTPVSALLHSACYVKAGAYLIARMYSIGPWHAALGHVLLVIGCLTMLIGVVFAMAQTDLKRLLAFHTVSQLGYVVTGLALGTSLGVAAGLFYAASHALFKGTLFMCAGAVQHATGTRDMQKLGGLSARMPVTTYVWLAAAASIVGVPLTNGFVAKWLLFNAALDANQAVVVVVAWAVSLITTFSFLKATVNVFYGIPSRELCAEEVHEASPTMLVGMAITGGLCLVFGFAPQLMIGPVIEPAVRALGFGQQIQVTWLGILTDSGSIGVTLGAAAGLALAVLFGVGAYRLVRKPLAAQRVAVFSGGENLPDDDTLGAADFAHMAEDAFEPVYALDPDPLYFAIWRKIRQGAVNVGRFATSWLERQPALTALVTAAVLFVAVSLL